MDSRAFPLILQAHKCSIVNHHTIITPFLVPLNERESRGGQTVRLTVRFFVNEVTSLTRFESRFSTQFRTRTEYRKTLPQKLQLFQYPSPQNLNFNGVDSTMTKTYISTHRPTHVTTISLHVVCLKHASDAKYYNVIEALARFLSTLGDVHASKIHHHYQCDEVFYVRWQAHIWLVKLNFQDSIQVWLNGSFKVTQK